MALGFFVSGMPGILMAVLIWLYVKEPVRKWPARINRCANNARLPFDPAIPQRLAVLPGRGWIYLLAVLQNVFAPLYITEVMNQAPTTAGFLLGAAGFGSFFIGIIFPGLSDRWGRKPTLIFLALLFHDPPAGSVHARALRPLVDSRSYLIFDARRAGHCRAHRMVLVPAESVPPQFSAMAIGLATLVGEIIGTTYTAPSAPGGALPGSDLA